MSIVITSVMLSLSPWSKPKSLNCSLSRKLIQFGHSNWKRLNLFFFFRFDNFGIAVYSAIPLRNTDIKSFTEYDIPSIFAEVQWQGQTVSIIATHPLPPINAEYFKSRNQQLLELEKVISSTNTIHAVIGDLNTTMWSPYYRKFIRQTGLKNARSGFGILPTWPQGAPMLQIPLDHCLISPEINVLKIRTGGDIGSDHRPLIIDLVIPTLPARSPTS